jgi:elongation factor Ts
MNTIETLKQLRHETGAGVMDCRKALDQTEQNYDRALQVLRELAADRAVKHADRPTVEGLIELYSHNNGRIGVMVEVNTETDFAAHSESFLAFVHEIALQIAASAPLYVCDADMPAQILTDLADDARRQALAAGKPERILPVIVEGVTAKYLDQAVLLRQPCIRDEEITVARLLEQKIGQIGENIVIRRFLRWEIVPEEGELE